MDNDAWGRTISMTTADGVDTYTVYESDTNFTFTVGFPTGSDTDWVYGIINQILPGNSDAAFPDNEYTEMLTISNLPCGPTSMRPIVASMGGNGYGYAYPFFDQTLNKPIWYVGWGTTGWVDATGTQV